MKQLLIAGAALAVLAPASAFAQEHEHRGGWTGGSQGQATPAPPAPSSPAPLPPQTGGYVPHIQPPPPHGGYRPGQPSPWVGQWGGPWAGHAYRPGQPQTVPPQPPPPGQPTQPSAVNGAWRGYTGGQGGQDRWQGRGYQPGQPGNWQGRGFVSPGATYPPGVRDAEHRDWDHRGEDHRGWDRRGDDHRGWDRDGDRRPGYWRGERGRPYSWGGRTLYRFRVEPYRWPQGYGYYGHRWRVHERLLPIFLSPEYFISDVWAFGLEPPPPGLIYIRVGADILLVDQYSGEIIEVIPDVFYW